jgi:hypothetical protein
MTNCSFPAEALIREMRRVCADADAVNDLATISKASRYARRTIELRKDHEEMYNCDCWLEALKKVKASA